MDCPRRPNVIKRSLKWKEGGKRLRVREENVTTKAEFEVTCKQNLRNLSPYTLKNVMDPLPSTKLPGGAAYFRLLSSRTIIV